MTLYNTNNSKTIMILAGGTGGHIYPGIAVANYLRNIGINVVWIGTNKGLESEIVVEAGFTIEYISVSGIRGKGIYKLLSMPIVILLAIYQCIRILRKHQPLSVLGMGGYVAGPGGVASVLLGLPLYVHEQNAKPGLTNRLLQAFASTVFETVPNTFKRSSKTIVTGNPVRENICQQALPDHRFADRGDEYRLLVIGGSLGAQFLNNNIASSIAKMPSEIKLDIWHQVGKGKAERTRALYQAEKIEARVDEYIKDMAQAYSWADLVICRAGASTIAELAAIGLGSILVPYPYAVDDHQTANAKYLVDSKSAYILPQDDFTAVSMAKLLSEIFSKGRHYLLRLANNAHKLATPDATKQIAQFCMGLEHV